MAVADVLRRLFGGPPPPELAAERQDFLRATADLGRDRLDRYRLYEDYYDGEQRTRVLDRAKLYLQTSGIRFAENITETVIDVFAERLCVEGFEVTDNEPAADWLTNVVWHRNRGDELQGIVHTEVPKLGDGFLIVDWDDKRAVPRFRWNHPRLIKPVYDDDGEMLYAVKKWSTTARGPRNPSGRLVWRLNLYLPDRVEKWFSIDAEGENWAPWIDEDGEQWPVPWTESGTLPADGEADDPLGIAVIHFRNKPKGRQFGRSETRGVIPYQDEINKQVLDLFYVMDAQGGKQRWATGVPEDTSLKLAWGEWIRSTSPDTKFGELSAEDPRPLLEAIDATLRRLSVKTGTPLHDLIKGTPPSGEALKTAESRLVKKAHDRMTALGHSWSDVASLGWRLAAIHGTPDVPTFDPDADITPVWEDPETRNEQTEAATLVLHEELGASRTTLLRKLGYDPDEERTLREQDQPPMPAPPAPPTPGAPAPAPGPPPILPSKA